jgi:cyclophilin family peptidyl-prolyl cis-trans isomerase
MKRQLISFLAFALLSALAHAANPIVELKTSMGGITLELYPDKAPRTVENFLQYVREGFYNGTIFHRVIDGFMIQGGGFDRAMKQKETRPPIQNEAANGLANEPGTIAMARTAQPHSATAQFFINLVDNRALNYVSPDQYGYCVFGRVTQGFEVAKAIAKLQKTRVGPHADVPQSPIVIESVVLVGADKPGTK